MLFHSAMRKLEQDRTLVMFRPDIKKYVHLTNGISLTKAQTEEMLTADIQAKKLSYMLVTIDDDLIVPYSPNFEDIISTDWQVKPMEVSDDVLRHSGIVRVDKSELQNAIDIVEGYGYGEYVSCIDNRDGTVMATFESRLFEAPRMGEPTPMYMLTVDQVNRTIRAKRMDK